MSNEQILKKAIEKVVKNGFKYASILLSDKTDKTIITIEEKFVYKNLIFSHDFAKAFWGEEECKFPIRNNKDENDVLAEYTTLCWQGHIVKMVLEKEPLKYLEKFLK